MPPLCCTNVISLDRSRLTPAEQQAILAVSSRAGLALVLNTAEEGLAVASMVDSDGDAAWSIAKDGRGRFGLIDRKGRTVAVGRLEDVLSVDGPQALRPGGASSSAPLRGSLAFSGREVGIFVPAVSPRFGADGPPRAERRVTALGRVASQKGRFARFLCRCAPFRTSQAVLFVQKHAPSEWKTSSKVVETRPRP